MSDNAEARPKLLVADDSKVMRLSAKKILEPEFELVVEPDGVAAWERLSKERDILALFSDVGMPGMDGYQLLERIRSSEDSLLQALPVIIVTGNDEESARDKALEKGATDFITKPFDRTQLLARARAHASHDRMRRRARELEASNVEDSVTGLGNARYFEKRLREARAHCLRHGYPLALLRVDLMDFEALVKRRGKRVAADVLREVGAVLQDSLREEDVVARLGGARFAVICPDNDRSGAKALAERLVETLGGTKFAAEHQATVAPVAGVYLASDSADEKLEAIYQSVQAALSEAGQRGPGTVMVHPPTAEAEPDQARSRMEDALYDRLHKMLSRLPGESADRVIARLQEAFGGSRDSA
ncbi:GGDEF domain-containing protein [Natronospira sp.]|uniref:GGDEF domain-containing protein n=1 Tax=Natronospira sp. TaxID=2024970 RepID=UPI003873A948